MVCISHHSMRMVCPTALQLGFGPSSSMARSMYEPDAHFCLMMNLILIYIPNCDILIEAQWEIERVPLIMNLIERNIKLEDMLLDVNNPRSIGDVIDDQQDLQNYIMSQPDTQTLLYSMIEKIRWVNRIVVRRDSHSNKFIVVEGNTRTACLKSGKIPTIDEQSLIPVLEAVQEPNETEDEFEAEIMVLQGIANVMSVKEWASVKKARHVYFMFKARERAGILKSINKDTKEIANTMGINVDDVRRFIRQYAYFQQIELLKPGSLIKQDFSYLEAIDKNEVTRTFFGFDKDANRFEWEITKSPTKEMKRKKERLVAFPLLIQVAKNALTLRKLIPDLIMFEDDTAFFDLINGKLSWSDLEKGNLSRYEKKPSPPAPQDPPAAPGGVGDAEEGKGEPGSQPAQENNTGDSDLPEDNAKTEGMGEKEKENESPDDAAPEADEKETSNEQIEFVMWGSKRYVAKHVDSESSDPIRLSNEQNTAFFYKRHPLYKSIYKKNQFIHRTRILLAIIESEERSSNKEEFYTKIMHSLDAIWS